MNKNFKGANPNIIKQFTRKIKKHIICVLNNSERQVELPYHFRKLSLPQYLQASTVRKYMNVPTFVFVNEQNLLGDDCFGHNICDHFYKPIK